MNKERFIERQCDVRKTAARLSESVVQLESNILRDATIQRFEFAFEATWKTLKLYLEHQGYECSGPRPTLKKACASGLIATEEEADVWMSMLEDRNLASHAYHESLASRIYRNIVKIHAPLLHTMAGRIADLTWD